MRCIHCGTPCSHVIVDYGGTNIRLEKCKSCGKFADKYVEYETTLIIIDMLLHRVEVFRHLLFNRQFSLYKAYSPILDNWSPYILVLSFGILDTLSTVRLQSSSQLLLDLMYKYLLGTDVNIDTKLGQLTGLGTIICKMHSVIDSQKDYLHLLSTLITHLLGYIVFAGTITLSSVVQHYVSPDQAELVTFPQISNALIVSSLGKFLFLLMMVWPYPVACIHVVNGLVYLANAAALMAQLNAYSWRPVFTSLVLAQLMALLYFSMLSSAFPVVSYGKQACDHPSKVKI